MNWFMDMELSRIHREELLAESGQVKGVRSWDALPRKNGALYTLQGLKLRLAERRIGPRPAARTDRSRCAS